jgi:hypothetical protein
MDMKKCSKCGVEYPKTYEYFNKSGKYMSSWCKKCFKAYNDSNKAYKQQYYLKNKEKYNEMGRKRYRDQHPLNETEMIPEGYKKCCKCEEIKPATTEYFGRHTKAKDGFKYSCKECRKAEYMENQERNILKSKKHYKENKEWVLERNKEYKEQRKEWYRQYAQQYYQDNMNKIKQRVKENFNSRLNTDIGFKVLQRCRKRIWDAVKRKTKSKRTIELIGCTADKLIEHLESQFKDGMTWENYGEWHIDHIKPCAKFDFSKESDQRECFRYTNLQPLWAKDNMRKSSTYKEHSN